jgi:diguanylate cyclase (GGDEF)-like protein/PAS domain S-box-containing protein
MRAIADNLPALMAYVDADRTVIFANRSYVTAYAIAREKLTGIGVRELLGEDVYAQSEVFMRDALAGRAVNFERLVTHTGAVRWERVSYVPERAADGTVVGFIALAEDITELKRAQHTFAKSEMRLRTITDNMPALIAYIDRDQHYRFCNGYHETILNLPPEKVLGQTVRQVMGEAGYAEIAPYLLRVLNGERVSFEQQVDQASGRHFLHDLIPETEVDGTVTGFYSMVLDITARKAAELGERASQKLLRSVTDNLPALVCYIDADERFQFNNQPYEKWFSRPLAQITGQRVADLMSPSDFAIHQPYYEQARNGSMAEFEFEATQEGGQHFYRAAYLPQFDDAQRLTGVCGMINDITTLKRVEQQLRILARHDTLTGLPNRNQFDDKLADAMARSRRSGTPMALMFLDIDHFKSINDTLGHQGGDAVLRQFAERLTNAVRATDTVARLAGDEFVIILEGLHLAEECATVAKKIIAAMTGPFDVLGHPRQVTTSVGIAIGHGDDTDGDALLRRADDALYDAKAAGRNTFRVAD